MKNRTVHVITHIACGTCSTAESWRMLGCCSAMVLNYLGAPTSYNRLVKLLEIIPDTGVASSKVQKIRRLGVLVVYQRGSIGQLRTHLLAGQPCIVFVMTRELPYRDDDTSHAVVVVGMDDEGVYVHDPEYIESPKWVSYGDFDLAWFEHDEMYAAFDI